MAFVALTGVVTAAAQATLKLAFQTVDNAVSMIEAKSLDIVISGDKLTASNGAESLEFDLSKLAKMYFTNGEAGVEIVPVDFASSEASAYTLDGVFVGKYESVQAAAASLPKGVYVMQTADGKTVKIAVQ